MKIWLKRTTVFLATTLAMGLAHAQVDKPIKILVGFPPGGSADMAARLVGERMAAELKQPVIIENKPGAGGRIAAEALKNANPDGTTLLLTPVVVPVLAPLVFSKLPYNPSTDFAPVAQIATFQFSLSVNAAHPAKNVPELINWMKANPAQANFGSPAPGSLPHFFGVMISTGANVDMVHVPFNGGAPLMNAVAGSQVSTGIDALVDQIEMHRAGKTRILATSGAKRSPLLPDVPTFVESGLKNVEGAGWLGLYATGKTPTATLNALNAAANKALSQTELRERFIKVGLEPTGGSAQDLADIMKRDTERWGPVVKASGFKAD
jgi:tripartite-type tricarboxylate transporter receptor subunit TctC